MSYLLHQLLDTHTDYSAREAVVDGDRSFSYRDFVRATELCAGVLADSGFTRGDRVAIYLPKSYEECWSIFGTSRADGVFVPINPLLRPQQVKHIIEDCGAHFLITDCQSWDLISDTISKTDCLSKVLLIDTGSTLTGENIVQEAFKTDSKSAPAAQAIGEDLAAILYTSGSTGQPKGVMLSHRNLLAGTRIVCTYLDINQEDRILSILPFSFDYGLNQLLTALKQGATTVLLTFRFGDEVIQAIERHRITGLAGVPTLWAILTRTATSLPNAGLRNLRYITNSGGAVSSETISKLGELLPDTDIYLMYGLTEAFRSTYLPPDEIDLRPKSMGKAIPECEIFVIGKDGKRCKPGQPGILVHRGPTVSMGYWNRPDATDKVLRPNPLCPAEKGGDLVCYSGDLVTVDEDGYFYFVGRNDAMIKSSGYRISPSEVEEALMVSGCFAQVAAIGLPDPVVGQRVHAIAVPSRPHIDIPKILEMCAQTLPAHVMPRDVEIVDILPTSPNGKIDYKSLVRDRTVNGEA